MVTVRSQSTGAGIRFMLLKSTRRYNVFIYFVRTFFCQSGRQAHYKLTSTLMLWLQTNKPGSGIMNLGGSLTRQVTLSNDILLHDFCCLDCTGLPRKWPKPSLGKHRKNDWRFGVKDEINNQRSLFWKDEEGTFFQCLNSLISWLHAPEGNWFCTVKVIIIFQVLSDLRSIETAAEREKQDGIVREIATAVTSRTNPV